MKKSAKKGKRRAELIEPIGHLNILNNAKKKYFLPTFNEINNFGKTIAYTMPLSYPVNKMGKISYKKVLCDIKLNRVTDQPGFFFRAIPRGSMDVGGLDYSESYGLDNYLYLADPKKKEKFVIEKKSIADFEWGFEKKKRVLKGRFLNFKSENSADNGKSFWRLVVPISEIAGKDVKVPSDLIDFKENHMVFDNPRWNLQPTLIGIPIPTPKGMFVQVSVKNNSFEFYTIPDVKAMIIDSVNEIKFNDFKNITTIIRTAFGFLSGKCYRDEAYYVSAKEENFKKIQEFVYQAETPTIISDREILNHQLFFEDFREKDQDYQQMNRKHHSMMSTDSFSSLCEQMFENETFHRTVDLVLSAMSNKSPIEQGALYSVAIETLTSLIKDEDPQTVEVIKNKELVKKIKQELLNIISKEKDKISTDGIESAFEIISQKIGQINEAPNAKKLTIPFDTYKIKLEKDDVKAIKNRNVYLHGNSPLATEETFQLELIALQLHTLIGSLILKYSGYEGHVVNLHIWHHFGNRKELISFLKKVYTDMTTHSEEFKTHIAKNNLKKANQAAKKLQEAIRRGASLSKVFRII